MCCYNILYLYVYVCICIFRCAVVLITDYEALVAHACLLFAGTCREAWDFPAALFALYGYSYSLG